MSEQALHFFLNPRAGRVEPQAIIHAARRSLWGYRLYFHELSENQSGADVIYDLNPKDTKAVVVCGGDGSIHHLLEPLRDTQLSLAILPYGTANDLAQSLGMSRDWAQFQAALDRGRVRSIDLIEVNGKSFVTVGGVGVGALLSEQINEGRKDSKVVKALSQLLREELYAYWGAKTIVLEHSWRHRLRLGIGAGEAEDVDTGLILVCNQGFLAKDLRIAPLASQDDGLMNVALAEMNHRQDLLGLLYQMKRGKESSALRHFTCTELSLKSLDNREIAVFGDGEAMLAAKELQFTLRPGVLRVIESYEKEAEICVS